jgi:nucleoside-diphosphate-sugar epimerase
MNERIFVTGASGLVGFNVVKYLLNHGHDVVAGVRPSSNTEALRQLSHGAGASGKSGSLLILASELLDTPSLSNAMRDCHIVIHCAGAVDPHARREDIVGTNVGGTRSALKASIQAGAKQFIHISSLSVITGQEDQFNVDETAPLRYCGEAYADSKVDAEKVVSQEAGTAINWTILRPGFIYGPGEKAWLPRLITNIRAGKAMLIDGGTRQTNVIYVDNLAYAVELSLGNQRAFGQTFNLTDGKTPSKKELFDAISDGLGLPRVTKSVPRAVVKVVCNVVSVVAPMLSAESRKGLSRFSRAAFRLAGVNQGFSVAKAERELGYVERVPFQQGMKETLSHFAASEHSGNGSQMAASMR